MVQIGIGTCLVLIGILIGRIRREFLLYLLFVLFPLFGAGTIKGIELTFCDVAVYMCAIPQTVFLFFYLTDRNRRNISFAGLIVLLVLFVFYLGDRYWVSMHPDRLYFLKQLLFATICFVYTLVYGARINPRVLIGMTGSLIFFETVVAVFQMVKGVGIDQILFFIDPSGSNQSISGGPGLIRATGTFPDPNYYALYMGIIISSILAGTKRPLIKIIYFWGLAGIIFSLSRMGVIICCILLGMYWLQNMRFQSARYISKTCFWLAGLILTGVWLVGNYAEIPMVSAIVERFQYNNGNIGDAKGTRDYILKFYYQHLMELNNPLELVIGSGLQNFEYLLNAKTGVFLVAHNEYLQILADIGLLGYGFLTAITFYLLRKSRQKNLRANPYKNVVVVMLFGFFFLTCTYEIYCYFYLALFFNFKIFPREQSAQLFMERGCRSDEDKSDLIAYPSLRGRPAGGILR